MPIHESVGEATVVVLKVWPPEPHADIPIWFQDESKRTTRVAARTAVAIPNATTGTGADLGAYILRRILLMIPTLLGIMAINFAVIQFAPGGPVQQIISQLNDPSSSTDRFTGGGGGEAGAGSNS